MKYLGLFLFLLSFNSYSEEDITPISDSVSKEIVVSDEQQEVEKEEEKLEQCDEINILWVKKFHKDFKVNWPVSTFDCSSEWMVLPSGIFFIYKNPWAINDKIVDIYSWLTRDLLLLDYREDNKNFPGAFGTAIYGKITLYRTYFEHRDHSVIGANMLIHEHRHNKRGAPLHQLCQWGVYKGQLACDHYFDPWGESAGSYSYEIGFLKAVRQSKQAPFIKEIAKAWEQSRILNNFNAYPSQMEWNIK